jgi:hypothetical protein
VKSRTIAWVVAIVIVVAAIALTGFASLAPEKRQALETNMAVRLVHVDETT